MNIDIDDIDPMTRKQALQELAAHGISETSDDFPVFFRDCGDHATYNVRAVFTWLGY